MIIPAIDIYKGKVVRLRQGKFNKISYEDHIKIFDGLPTKSKIKILSNKYSIPIK